jgi:hypothetical protein
MRYENTSDASELLVSLSVMIDIAGVKESLQSYRGHVGYGKSSVTRQIIQPRTRKFHYSICRNYIPLYLPQYI